MKYSAALSDDAPINAAEQLLPDMDLVAALHDPERRAEMLAVIGQVATPDVEVLMVGGGGTIGPFTGTAGFEQAWREWLEAFASYRVEPEPDVRHEGDTVVVFAQQIATPKGTTQPVTNDGAIVVFLDEGKARRIEFHLDRGTALRAAGLA
jgi:ketosteroid isomerase-like protein